MTINEQELMAYLKRKSFDLAILEEIKAIADDTSGLNELAAEIHENAKAHGWYDTDRGFPEVIALMHSELSEALEEYRDGKPMIYGKTQPGACVACGSEKCDCEDLRDTPDCDGIKPQGIAVELADTIIRILDTCAYMGIDIERAIALKHEYNKCRPYRHGGKKA